MPLTHEHKTAALIARSWRELTGGGPTLVACSGGADSVALLLALDAAARRDATNRRAEGGAAGSARPEIAAAFVVHDLRPREEELADAEFVRSLCARLGVAFVMGEVTSEGGNAEGVSRERRYALLAQMAAARGMRFVATGHHADDQLETLVMALVRGSGPAGLRGVAPSRALEHGVTLIRPMLGVTRAECQRMCRDAGVTWREDWTNGDTRRLRAALRAGPIAELVRLRPESPRRAARTAALMRDVTTLIDDAARSLARANHTWTRAELRGTPGVVVAAVLRNAAGSLTGGAGLDALGERVIDPVVRAIGGKSARPRVFEWAMGVRVRVTSREVRVWREDAAEGDGERGTIRPGG